MWYQIIKYLKFLYRSTNQHGVHSPFVYDLVTNCFYDRTNYEDYKSIASYRNELLSNKKKINVIDLGVGSQKITSNERSIAEMAKYAGTTFSRAKLLYRITNYFKPKQILELGTSLGIASYAMLKGYPKCKITTVEGCENIHAFSKYNLLKNNINNIELINKSFDSVIKEVNKKSFDLIFFDGNHQKEATLAYFEALLTTIHNDAVFIFDDIYLTKNMTEAWEEIKSHPKVKVTIDTYYWGFVFFRSEQKKEHFTIRV
jgi:predicted O-methyltransferase YrrM